MPNTRISCCVTSCNRHDLLRTTLESFYEMVDLEPQELIIYEDSDVPMPEWLSTPIWRQRGLNWIAGGERRGQVFAVARLIQEAQYEYTFWLECDWLFQRDRFPFMAESKKILDAHPEIILVSLRGDTGWHPLVSDERYPFKIAEPYWRGVWGGYAHNPGLRRTQELKHLILPNITRSIGKGGLVHEEQLSKMLLDKGHRIADLNRAVISHIGGGRSRSIEKLPPLPRILIAVPTCFQFDYESHGGGEACADTGFHQNGANEQTNAVRETWGKDVAHFANVDLKFFYGKPADGYPREPLPDEVFLDCPDGYDSLIHKTVAVCQYAVENDYKFVFKCDTDTYVFVERLLIEIMQNRFDYAGYRHADVCSGGPGYLLSSHACRIIATQGRTPQHPYAEDVHTSRVLAAAGIQPLMLPGHRPGFSDHFFFWNAEQKREQFNPALLRDEHVSYHAVFPQAMRDLYTYMQTLEGQHELA